MRRSILASIVFIFCLFILTSFSFGEPTPEPERSQRVKWWRDAKFGMFIHWGLYAIPAGEWNGEKSDGYSEWIMHERQIPVGEYEKLAGRFKPVSFDAERWVRLAKRAGMKYIVITSKHHDGFAMFDTKVSGYDIVDSTPFGRDVVDELSEACVDGGIKFGAYYSVDRDWHHPGAEGNFWDYPDEDEKDFEGYLEAKAIPQVRELLNKYPISIMWFDGIGKKTDAQNKRIIKMVRRYRPECLINSRLGDWMSYKWGDYHSMDDNQVSNRNLGYGWENPGTINTTYGYNKHDRDWKSSKEIIRMLVDIVSNGGNYLLNVGPKADGTIPAKSVKVLEEVGEWMRKYGESIYGTSHSPIPKQDWGRCTAKPGRLYLHIFDWPARGELKVCGVKDDVKAAYLLGDGDEGELCFRRAENGELIIELAEVEKERIDKSDTVIALDSHCGNS